MNDLFKVFTVIICMLVSTRVFADFFGTIGYKDTSDEILIGIDDLSTSMSALYISAGYKFKYSNRVSIVPQISYAVGTSKDDIDNLRFGDDLLIREKVSLEQIYDFSLSVQYQATDTVYGLVSVVHSNADYEGEISGFKDSNSGLGFGAGVGFNVYENMSIQLMGNVVSNRETFSLGFRYSF